MRKQILSSSFFTSKLDKHKLMRPLQLLVGLFAIIGLSVSAGFAQSGKIAGTVTDAETGSPLPGVNVIVEGTQQGATTNTDGYYSILNVSPGTYAVRASFVGYASQTVENVSVRIDLTTNVGFELSEATVGLEEVTVQATEPVVRPDVSANVANLSSAEVENIPVSSVQGLVGLQAGVEGGLSIRGGGRDDAAFVVDGQSMRDARTNSPFTGISYTSVKEIQVQTGGFNAEYGNVRSGLINVASKEAPRDRYIADVIMRYHPPTQKHFGPPANDRSTYYMRPYLNDEVAFAGTENGSWDKYTQRQYQQFEGWDAVADKLNKDSNPENDLTPQQAQQVFAYHHRKSVQINASDYTVDASMGGPVPGISDLLGDLRFFASFRQKQEAYVVPQIRDAYKNQFGQLKVTSDLAKGIKLRLDGMYNKETGLNGRGAGFPGMIRWDNGMVHEVARGNIRRNRKGIFADDEWPLMDITRHMVGGELTHTLSSSTFYNLRFQRKYEDYFTREGRHRDFDTVVKKVGPMELNEEPFGYTQDPVTKFTRLWMGRYSSARDSSEAAIWRGSFDITSQLNRHSQLKAGFEYIYSNYHTIHGDYEEFYVNQANPKFRWFRQPQQGAAYAQNKLEFQGLIANLGVRLDYFNASGEWYDYSLFDRAFSQKYGYDELDTQLEQRPVERKFNVSPRIGVSFPVSASSKLYFNYGHFYQMLNPNDLFVVRRVSSGAVDQVGNPSHPMPRSVAYELGYEHNLFNQFLLRLAGYYKALDDQPRRVAYTSLDHRVTYRVRQPNNYEDIRGFEITLRKNSGQWIRGFANYSFMVRKQGNFGFGHYYENPVDQQYYELNSNAHYQWKPVPEPYARASIEFLTPSGLGPSFIGEHPFGDWRLNLLGSWRAGNVFTWTGGKDRPGVRNNVRWTDRWNLDLRLSKNLATMGGEAQFFVDVSNMLNLRHMSRGTAFLGPFDFQRYMESLHLPMSAFEELDKPPYKFIPGDDAPGDYRQAGVKWVPIEIVASVETVEDPHPRPLYYEEDTQRYMTHQSGGWTVADSDQVEQVLEDKAYIDMPNHRSFTFLNPRQVVFGLRITL